MQFSREQRVGVNAWYVVSFSAPLETFDKHRKGDHDNRYCVDPEDVGLVIGESHGNTFWKGRGNDELLGVWK
jgi:hypothetical protein